MTAEFYLFDVDHGQCAALKLPNNRWCMFDVGESSRISPTRWISLNRKAFSLLASAMMGVDLPPFKFLMATISHHHGDHLGGYAHLFQSNVEYLHTPIGDSEYTNDVISSNSTSSLTSVLDFMKRANNGFGPITTIPDFGGVAIRELSLPVGIARQIGGDANAHVNNASIITRIDVYGNAILLCGDMMKEAWEFIIADRGQCGNVWRPFLRNIDVLVAPHHGHRSGYSVDLLNLAKPSVVLISATSRDEHVDSRYSGDPVTGIRIGETDYHYISTRKQGHVRVDIAPPANGARGKRTWTFGDAALAVT